jgi:hypothetical protein
MTPDVDEIRTCLAALSDEITVESQRCYRLIRANAPVWLAALCTEVERLRADAAADRDAVDFHLGEIKVEMNRLAAERDAALAEVELVRLTAFTLEGQRDAALAECERLRSECAELRGAADDMTDWENYKAWRACADRLAAACNTRVEFGDLSIARMVKAAPLAEALAVYESLSRGAQAPEAGETTL